jgi:protein O-GlcNAc transferase
MMNNPAALLQQAEALLAAGPGDAALVLLTEAMQQYPEHAMLTCRHADALHMARQFERAADGYRHALMLDQGLVDAWYGLGNCLLSSGARGAATEALERAIFLRPDGAGIRCNLAEALFHLGRVDEAVRHYAEAADRGTPEVRTVALEALACIAPGAAILDNGKVLALRRLWASEMSQGIEPLATVPQDPRRKLRVGYISGFFGARNWMKPVFGVINQHDRLRFEIHLLSDGGDPAESSGYQDHEDDVVWPIADLSNEKLARSIVGAGLDVLVDLNSYSAQRRLPLFLYRPARRQIAWFNAYATTGISAFDYLVGDAAVVPPEEDGFYTERIHRVPGTYLAFSVDYPVPDVTPPPCIANGHITFGCLASSYKLTDATIDSWSHTLRAAPRARLLLKNSGLDDASNCDALLTRFARRGVAHDRLSLEGGDEHFGFLQAYGRIDIALDPFPYNGGTTTTEALWQGVPVLSFNGDRWASRTSRSLLLAADLPDWVRRDQADYVAAAIRLAVAPETPNQLAALRAGMRHRLLVNPVCDCKALCRELEHLYLSICGPACIPD